MVQNSKDVEFCYVKKLWYYFYMFYDVNANADLDLDPKIQMGILIL